MPHAKQAVPPLPGEAAVRRRIDRARGGLLDFIRAFCRIGTVNPPGLRYADAMEFLERKLRRLGLVTRVLRVPKAVQARLAPGLDDHPRYNLVARWDVGARRTLHFTGHYDVVPPTSGWKSDPFAPFVQGKKLVGRGTGDMKASDAAAIFAVQALLEERIRPPWNLELSFTADEETGGYAGLGHLARTGLIRPDAAVLLEGGSGDHLGYAHRGVLWLDITVLGKSGHASNPRNGINALEKACALIAAFKTLERPYARRRSRFLASGAARHPTLMLGGLSGGGGKVNTIPDRFHFTMDRRLIPEDRLGEVKAELRAVIHRARRKDRALKVHVAYPLYVEPGWTDPRAAICQVARAAHHAVTGRRARFRMTGGFTDMHWLTNDLGVPTIGYGVGGGGAHSDFEWSEIPDQAQCAKIYAAIALRMSDGK